MNKRWFIVMLAFAVFFSGIAGTGIAQVHAAQPNILTKVTLKDRSGTVIDSVYNPSRLERSQLGDAVDIEYEWALENGHGYDDGDSFEFDIPQEFQIYSNINGHLYNEDDESIATFTVDTSGHVTVVFNDKVNNSEVRGTLKVETEFSTTKITGSVEVPITFPIRGGNQVATVFFEPHGGDVLTKSGAAFKDQKIDWTVDINTKLDKIDQASFSDLIPTGLTLDPGSIQINDLQVNINSAPTLGGTTSAGKYNLTTAPDGSSFSVAFTDASITSAYRITYTTLVTDEEIDSFTNKAELRSNTTLLKTVPKTVPIERVDLMTKAASNYDANAAEVPQTVTWTVKYNYGEKSLTGANALIEDRFDTSMELVGGAAGVKVYYKGTSTELSSSLYTVTPVNNVSGKNGFDLQFLGTVNEAFDIKYETRAINRIYSNTTVTNNVYSVVNGKTWDVNSTHTFRSAIGVKSVASTDYDAKEVTWRIVVNRDKKPMTNLEVVDTFSGGGLEFIPGSLGVTSSGGTVASSTYTVLSPTPASGFSVNFTGTITDAYTITYKTKFTPEQSLYRNTAVLDWTERALENPTKVTLVTPFTPSTISNNNGEKLGSYNATTKEITWTIKANYNSQTINNALITDELLDGQTLVPGSVEVSHMNVPSGGTASKGGPVTPVPVIDYTGNKLEISLGNINSPYWITFKTKLDKTLVVKDVDNTATLTGDGGESYPWSRTVTIPRGEVYVLKEGVKNGDNIDWTIKINEGQSYVQNAKIVDTPSNNQILIESSFKLYEANVASGGGITPGTLLIRDTDYTLDIQTNAVTGQETFELILPTEIETAYILQYSSEIAVSVDREKVSNEVEFIGDGVMIGTKETSEELEIRISTGSGTGSGVRGALEINKVDSADSSIKLSGAKFKLTNSSGTLIGEKISGADGKISFTKLLYGTYTLEETEAPAGYVLDSTVRTITIDSSVQSTAGVKTITVTNAMPVIPPTGELEVTKVDKADHSIKLSGAKFKLTDSSNSVVDEKATGVSGTVSFGSLPYGTYTLEETEAPAGYDLDNTVHTIVIDSSVQLTSGVKKIELENEKTVTPPVPTGTLEVIKVDKADHSVTLAGATFVLQDVNKLKAPITVTTDAFGKAVFASLEYDDYILEETAAPAGYQIDQATYTITIDSSVAASAGTLTYTVENSKQPVNPGGPSNPGNPSEPSNPGNPVEPTDPPKEVVEPEEPVEEEEKPVVPNPAEETDKGSNDTGKQQADKDMELDDNGNPLGGTEGEGEDPNKNLAGSKVKVLPKTGDESQLPIQLAGAALILLGLAVRIRSIGNK